MDNRGRSEEVQDKIYLIGRKSEMPAASRRRPLVVIMFITS